MKHATPVVLALSACGRIGFDVPATATDSMPALDDADAPLGAFGPAEIIPGLTSGTFDDDDPSLTDDLLEIYFDSNRPGGLGNDDLWMSRRASVTSPWETPVNLPTLSSSVTDEMPHISGDGLTIYWASDRPGRRSSPGWPPASPRRSACAPAPTHDWPRAPSAPPPPDPRATGTSGNRIAGG